MRCEKCGSKLPKGCTFCKECNTPVKRKPTFFEKIGRAPIIIIAAAAAVAAVGGLFFVLTNAPAVKFEADADTAKAVIQNRNTAFFDTDGNNIGIAEDVIRTDHTDDGTMFLSTAAGDLYIVRTSELIKADSGISGTRTFGCAENAEVVYYEKDGRLMRYDGEVTDISRMYGIVQYISVSPDGSCAAWGTSESGENKAYVYRNGNVEELSGADDIYSINNDGSLMFGTSGDDLVICEGSTRTFEPVCRCGRITDVSSDRTKVIITDEHNPVSTYLYDIGVGERIFLYSGSVKVYSPDGMHPAESSFDLFAAEVLDPRAGTQSLVLFSRDGASYKSKTLLGLDKVGRYILSANGDKVLYIKDGTLSVKSTVSSFAKENVIAEKVSDVYANSTLSDIYFLSYDNELYWSDGGAPEKISLNVGKAAMICDGVCTFISDGTLYYSEHGSELRRAGGIDRVRFLNGSTAVSEDEEQYITFDGKSFINTEIKRY